MSSVMVRGSLRGSGRGGIAGRAGSPREDGGLWRAYAKALEGAEVPMYQRPHYARWVRQFMRCAAGRLETRAAPEVSAFLESLDKLPHLERWQVEQAGAALALFYEKMLGVDLGKIELPTSEANEVIDFSSAPRRRNGALDAEWTARVDKLRAELRLRHYSLRTEDAYADWVRRYAVFHRLAPFEELREESLMQFLSHLATEGRVAASTQNQHVKLR